MIQKEKGMSLFSQTAAPEKPGQPPVSVDKLSTWRFNRCHAVSKPYNSGRNPGHDSKRRDITRHDGTGSHHRTGTNANAFKHRCPRPDPGPLLYLHPSKGKWRLAYHRGAIINLVPRRQQSCMRTYEYIIINQ